MNSLAARSSLVLPLLIAACASPPPKPPAATHLTQDAAAPTESAGIPPTVQQTLTPPRPKSPAKTETYSVVVNNVPVHDLLFALARDAHVNVDIHSGILGNVTLNAVDQTLPQILSRLSRQVDMRWELEGQTLSVMPDSPFLRHYKIDYVNLKRDATGSVAVSGEIGDATSTSGGGGGSSGGNASAARIDSTSKNHFWETLIQNVKDILHETDKILPTGSSDTVIERAAEQQNSGGLFTSGSGSRKTTGTPPTESNAAATTTIKQSTFREAASVIANPETGIISVRGTARQQEKIQQFLDQVMVSAKRQVLIEATIAEVELTQEYQQGINWGKLSSDATRSGIIGSAVGGAGSAQLVLGRNSAGTSDMAIRLLETFGTVKILSSPKIAALNNQSAIMRVVDNQVIFNIKANTNTNANVTTTTFTTEQRSVPVGFVMSVTPQISDADEIVLNVRPSITRLNGFETDPNPSLTNPITGVRIDNRVPNIRTREMETLLRVQNGSTAVLGGLMEDTVQRTDSAVPWFHSIPLLGALFAQKSSSARKTELVIFLRPTVIREASMSEDFAALRQHLPSKDFFGNNKETRYQLLSSDQGDEKK